MAMANFAPNAALPGARTRTIAELTALLGELQQIEDEESNLLAMAEERKDRKTQAKVINELVRIEEEQLNIMNQLQFVKEQRVVEKTRMLNEERKKLATMGNAATREANTPVGGGRRRSSTYSLRPSTQSSVQSGYQARSVSQQQSAGLSPHSQQPRNGSRNSSHNNLQQSYGGGSPRQVPDFCGGSQSYGNADVFVPEPSRLAPVRTRRPGVAPRPAVATDMTFRKRTRVSGDNDDDDDDDKKEDIEEESDFGREKPKKKSKQVVVSGGLPGFKIAKDLLVARQ